MKYTNTKQGTDYDFIPFTELGTGGGSGLVVDGSTINLKQGMYLIKSKNGAHITLNGKIRTGDYVSCSSSDVSSLSIDQSAINLSTINILCIKKGSKAFCTTILLGASSHSYVYESKFIIQEDIFTLRNYADLNICKIA